MKFFFTVLWRFFLKVGPVSYFYCSPFALIEFCWHFTMTLTFFKGGRGGRGMAGCIA